MELSIFDKAKKNLAEQTKLNQDIAAVERLMDSCSLTVTIAGTPRNSFGKTSIIISDRKDIDKMLHDERDRLRKRGIELMHEFKNL